MTTKPTIDESQIDYIEIKSKSELINLLKNYNSDFDKKTGFWLFDEAIKKDPKSYAEVNGGSWNIKYVEVRYQGETVGLISYSCDYKNYENEDILPTLHIFDIQTSHQLMENNLGKGYLFSIVYKYNINNYIYIFNRQHLIRTICHKHRFYSTSS